MFFSTNIEQVFIHLRKITATENMFVFRSIRKYNILPLPIRHYRSNQNSKALEENRYILYGDEASPPVRFVLMTAAILGIELDFHNIDIFKSEHKTEYFKKINPLQKVPVLKVDNDVICDSHAIALFLARKIDDQQLYPEGFLRSKVDEMLFFNSTTLFPIDSAIFTDYFRGNRQIDNTMIEKWNAALDYLEIKLNKNIWLANYKMLLCDLCCGATVSSLQLLLPISSQRHNKVDQWLKRLNEQPCFYLNSRGLKRLNNYLKLLHD